VKIAISGKGGVGKTCIAGGLAAWFAKAGSPVLAIDADPSPNLGLSLGLTVEEASSIVPIAEETELIRLKTGTPYSGVFRLSFTVDDILRSHAHLTPSGAYLMVMGTVRAMGSGCTCPAHSVIKALIRHLVVERNDVVILDMEAGIEHIGRGTAEHVDLLLIVADANRKSLEVGRNIHILAKDSRISRVALIGNRVADDRQRMLITEFAEKNSIELITMIPFDSAVADSGITGEGIDEQSSVAIREIGRLAANLGGSSGNEGSCRDIPPAKRYEADSGEVR
jgi:CO dehydrogenase maturation factor